MRKMLSFMKRPRAVSNAVNLPCVFLMAIALSGCSGLRKFPSDRLWEFDARENVCAEYRITDPEGFRFVHVRDVPRDKCPSIFGFTTVEIPKVLDWGRDAVKYGKEKCK